MTIRLSFPLIAGLVLASCGSKDVSKETSWTRGDTPAAKSNGTPSAASLFAASPGAASAARSSSSAPTQVGTGCERVMAGGKQPVIADERMKPKTRMICRLGYTSLHSGLTYAPLWSAELLTKEAVASAHTIVRVDNFHPEPDVPEEERAELKDYRGCGYDRGHMAPNSDMPSREAADQSFSLANIVPQAAGLNRKSWEDLEKSVRRQTRSGNVFIVTGPLYEGPTRYTTKARKVPIPSHTWKAIYVEGRGATVFVATNEDNPHWANMSVAQFAKNHGIDPFPAISEQLRNTNGS